MIYDSKIHECRIGASKPTVKAQHQIVTVIFQSNAVSRENTVMISTKNTSVTSIAVERSRWGVALTCGTKSPTCIKRKRVTVIRGR